MKSNGSKSPVGVISATNTGTTIVPCDLFFSIAPSYLVLVMFQNAKKTKQDDLNLKKKKKEQT